MACNSKKMNILNIRRIIKLMRSKDYIVYEKPYQLNIIGVRNYNTNPNKFDDSLYVIYKDSDNNWLGKKYTITTDPSTKYLLSGGIGKFEGKKSTAILPQGQYVDSFKIGSHRGQYEALVQSKSICVYRDYNRDSILDFNVEDKNCGMFGINIHRAKPSGADDGLGNTKTIGDYSAGCQVFQNYMCFLEFMAMARKQEELYGNKFTYTLIDKSLENKFRIKRGLYATTIIVGIASFSYGIYLLTNKK